MSVKFLLAVFVCLAAGLAAFAQSAVSIDETAIAARNASGSLTVSLPIDYLSRKAADGLVAVELLDADDRVLQTVGSAIKLKPGRSTFDANFRIAADAEASDIIWHRVRYAVTVAAERDQGVVSLSQIAPDLFAIRIFNIDRVRPGARVPVRVFTYHPIRDSPVGGVAVKATLEIDVEDKGDEDDEFVINGEAQTGADGIAEIVFLIPEDAKFESEYWGIDIKVTGSRNGLSESTESSPDGLRPRTDVFFITDKPLYQPGQAVHARALVMTATPDGDAMTVLAGLELELSVKDEDGTVLNRQNVKTSEFGIAAIEWRIPQNAKLGTYDVSAESDDVEFRKMSRSFRVSRYDLPNFAVKTKSDRDFYLPHERIAEVTVDAMYLFGKPVTAGSVRVVREGRRHWNYREQEWEIEEEAVYQGTADADGKYVAQIDLGQAQDNFAKNEDEKYSDLNFTAYFTDPSSNRTEQKRFDIRLTKEPVHVYLNYERRNRDHNPKLPYRLYVTTLTADGKPAACDVEITGRYEDESTDRPIAKLRTTDEGAGKSEFFVPERSDDTYYDDLAVKVVARADPDRAGTERFDLEIDEDEKQFQVSTDRSIYRKGEVIKIDIRSSEPEATVFVDVLKSSSAIETRRVRTKNSRAAVRIPYRPGFTGILTISASANDDGETIAGFRSVVFPDPRRLSVNAVPDRETYRPGDEAQLGFRTNSVDKRAVAAALGVVIVDQAVEERVRGDGRDEPDILGDLRGFGADTWRELPDTGITPRMQLFAEMRFASADVVFDESGSYFGSPESSFAARHKKQFAEIESALNTRFKKDFDHPTDQAGLKRILADAGLALEPLRDPWGTAFKPEFVVSRNENLLSVMSAGPNKKFGDGDDFRAFGAGFQYFDKTAIAFDKAIAAYESRTGTFVRDTDSLKAALAAADLTPESLVDRWGRPYRFDFGIWNRNFTIQIKSGGKEAEYAWDDFVIHSHYSDYFAATERRVNEILGRTTAEAKTFPKTTEEFLRLIKANGIDLESLRDGWGRPYYFEYAENSIFADRIHIESVARAGEKPVETLHITPVTRRIGTFRIQSFGDNGTKDEGYDLVVASFAGILSEQAREDVKPKVVVPRTVFANGQSAIFGVVKDANGALISGASVIIQNAETQAWTSTVTNNEGAYLQTGIPAGKYSIRVESYGFKTTVVNQIALGAGQISEIDITLEAGAVNEVVTVAGGATVTIDATESKMATSLTRTFIPGIPKAVSGGVLSLLSVSGNRQSGISAEFGRSTGGITVVTKSGGGNRTQSPQTTPRIRDYFPETLLFVPELVTGKDGRIAFRYKLADNITTWKIYAVASDKQGRIGFAETSVKAFQPFFADLEPPKFLTVGDTVQLPVQVRNYTAQTQSVNVTMDRSDWFAFVGRDGQALAPEPNRTESLRVASGETGIAVFGFRAAGAVTDGKQRVSAVADRESDGIEKAVTVRPDGEEVVRTESRVFSGGSTFALDFPENRLGRTERAELKIYPNLLAHVTESIEGLIKRPYGCGEQTISAAYPNLMLLKMKADPAKPATALETKARKYLERGYEQLVGFRSSDGGFTYWGVKSRPEIALTAYALRFLNDARSQIEVDDSLINSAREYLIKNQRSDGSWTVRYDWEKAEDGQRTKLVTAYVTRVLAMTRPAPAKPGANESPIEVSLKKALAYLKIRNAEIDEPYAIANYGLAALGAGDTEAARSAVEKLASMARTEADGAYWNLETNTPFYGWGTPGRVETTALVLLLLRNSRELKANDELISKATIFLLRNKDRYGVWYSTQTTVNVLDAFLAALEKPAAQNVTVTIGGKVLRTFGFAADDIVPATIDLAGPILSGGPVEVNGDRGTTLMAQVVRSHYIGWKDSRPAGLNNGLRLAYDCDRKDGKVMDNVSCAVEAERIGYKGYGMLLAEIGIPPGADVSRESLEKAMKDNGSIGRYEVQPDRIVFYLWAIPGGTKFSFSFKPRYGINAQTPPSLLYDYYNEEARATVAPLRFRFE